MVNIILVLALVIGYSHAVFECENSSACKGGSTCVKNICRCPIGMVLDKYGDTCLRLADGFGKPCTEDNQCATIVGPYKCRKSVCTCADGHVVLKGRCIKLRPMKETCAKDDDCFDGVDIHARMCKDGHCECNENPEVPWGYYERDHFDCRKRAKNKEACSIDIDCQHGVCKSGKCSIDGKTIHKKAMFEKEVRVDIPQNDIGSSSCSSNSDCATPNSECSLFLGKCRCKLGYFENKKLCHLELGMSCSDDEECKAAGGKCIAKKCACMDKLVSNYNRKCLKTPSTPEFRCSVDDSCKLFGSNYQCIANGLSKQCACDSTHNLNKDYICTPSTILRCKDSSECEQVKNSICGPMGVCVCDDNFYYNENARICVPNLGAVCEGDMCKTIANSVCSGGKCICDKGFVGKGNATCIKGASGIGAICLEDLECAGVRSDSICVDGKCTCAYGFVAVNDGCLKVVKKLGHTCSSNAVCSKGLGDSVICRNGKCVCNEKSVPNREKNICVLKSGGPLWLGSLLAVFGIALIQLWVF